MPDSGPSSRRLWLGGLGLGAAAAGAALVYKASPFFWRNLAEEIGRPIAPAPAGPDPRAWPDRGLYASWLGHATVLLKIDGFTLLTDPVFSSWIGISLGFFTLGYKRLVQPALSLAELPPVDLVLLSHAHMDHFDLPSLRALEGPARDVVTARATSDLLRVGRYRKVHELGWGERVRIGPATIQAMEVKHWGARMRRDTWRGYNAYRIQVGRSNVLFAGDTTFTHGFRGCGPFDLALMPIGAYQPWIRYHCSPEQAWQMTNEARADRLLPIHHDTFRLGREPVGEASARLLQAAGAEASTRVPVTALGEPIRLV